MSVYGRDIRKYITNGAAIDTHYQTVAQCPLISFALSASWCVSSAFVPCVPKPTATTASSRRSSNTCLWGLFFIRLMTADALYDLMRHNRRMCDRIVSKAIIEEYGRRREVAPSSKTESENHGVRVMKVKRTDEYPGGVLFFFYSRWDVTFRRSQNRA